MSPFRRLLVATSGTPSDDYLLAHATRLAKLDSRSTIVLVHTIDADVEAFPRLAAEARERILGRCPVELTAFVNDERARVLIAQGERLDGLLDQALALEAELIVIGEPDADAGDGRRALARRLAMKAPCSVLLVPAESPRTIEPVLVPIDFSPRAADALSVGTELAAAAGQESCLALHVRFNAALVVSDELEEMELSAEHDAFYLFVARIDLHGVDVEPVFEEAADVAANILEVAERVDAGLIVMGTRGRSRAAAVLLGSETEHVLMEARRPVLAVKHFGSQLRFLQALRDPRFRHRGGPRFS